MLKIFTADRGGLTVFLAIVLPILLLAGLILGDVYMYQRANALARSALDKGSVAILSQYSSYMKENYLLYGYHNQGHPTKKQGHVVFEQNLSGTSFYDFQIESFTFMPTHPFMKTQNVKDQIIPVMEDVVFEVALNEINDRLQSLDFMQQASELISLKMQLDEHISKMTDLINQAHQLTSGGQGLAYFVNMFLSDVSFSTELDEIIQLTDEIQKQYGSKNLMDDPNFEVIQEETIGKMREEAFSLLSQGTEYGLKQLRDINGQVLKNVQEIIVHGENIHFLSDALKIEMARFNDPPFYIEEILRFCVETIHQLENLWMESLFMTIEGWLETNVVLLENFIQKLLYALMNEVDYCIHEELDTLIKGYQNQIQFPTMEEIQAHQVEKDSRQLLQQAAQRAVDEIIGGQKSLSDEQMEKLPSRNKGSIKKVEFDIDVTEEDTRSVENSLSDFGTLVVDVGEKAKQEILLNEYLLMFLGNHQNNIPNTYLDEEVEYVLWGSPNEQTNRNLTKSATFLFRFVSNTLHVYSDQFKRTKATAIAAGISGWWTFGMGVPVLSNLIRCGWALAEAGLDTRDVFSGKRVPVFKLQGDWKTDLGLSSSAKTTPDALAMDYQDHLRLFLLMTSEENKIYRLLDIIQMNGPPLFDVTNVYAGTHLEATVSFRGLTGRRYEIFVQSKQQYQRTNNR